ncbi:MAG: methyltransferase domain-containing protein [Spartobacteria bacterium]
MKFPFQAAVQRGQPEPRISLPEIWSDEYGVAVRGWILTPDGPPDTLELILDGNRVPVSSWHTRHDVVAKHPEYQSGENCGFWAYLPKSPVHEVQFRASTGGNIFSRALKIQPKPLSPEPSRALFERFRRAVNEQRLSVLEIGSRVVAPGSSSRRTVFSNAASYTGFDLFPDENTDIVGDAHRLASYFAGQQFDAVFSLSVLEHLAMPWLVAAEINKILRPGGLTFHLTHFTFPLHERPADYWRFTDQGLRALFSTAVGFDHVETEFSKPASLHPHERTPELLHLPGQPSYIHVAVIATKVAEIDDSRIRWSPPDQTSAVYPDPDGAGG